MSETTQVGLFGTLIARLKAAIDALRRDHATAETDDGTRACLAHGIPNFLGKADYLLKKLEAALATLPHLDPSNHHNALKCPYCNPDGLVLALPQAPPQGLRKLMDEALLEHTDDAAVNNLVSALDRYLRAASPPAQAQELSSDLLDAPCRWCGYSGTGYWQEKTHSPWCPFRFIAGRSAREKLLKDFPREMKGSMSALPPAHGWQPIESYDRAIYLNDVLVATGYGVGEAMQHEDDGSWVWYWVNTHPTDALGPGQIYPTHWMPLPAPPVAAKETP